VLLADEATSGLDPETTGSILRLLTELRDDLGVTIVVITHEMDVVRSVADVVAHLDHGRIVEFGRVGDVVRRSDSALSTALLPDQPPPLSLAGSSSAGGASSAGEVVWQLNADIAPKYGLKITPVGIGDGPRVLPEVDAVIAYNMQFIGAGISQKYKIYAPPAPRAFAGQLVVGTTYLRDPQIVKLIKVFLDPRVQAYLRTTANPRLKDQLTPVSVS